MIFVPSKENTSARNNFLAFNPAATDRTNERTIDRVLAVSKKQLEYIRRTCEYTRLNVRRLGVARTFFATLFRSDREVKRRSWRESVIGDGRIEA